MSRAEPVPPSAIELHGDPALWVPVLDVLRQVRECGHGENPVDLGLVSRVAVDEEEINVMIVAASPVCSETRVLIDACFHALAKSLNGRADIYVLPDHQTLWSPGRMDEAARQRWHERNQAGGAA